MCYARRNTLTPSLAALPKTYGRLYTAGHPFSQSLLSAHAHIQPSKKVLSGGQKSHHSATQKTFSFGTESHPKLLAGPTTEINVSGLRTRVASDKSFPPGARHRSELRLGMKRSSTHSFTSAGNAYLLSAQIDRKMQLSEARRLPSLLGCFLSLSLNVFIKVFTFCFCLFSAMCVH